MKDLRALATEIAALQSKTEVIKAAVEYQGVTTGTGPVKLKPDKQLPELGFHERCRALPCLRFDLATADFAARLDPRSPV